MKVISIMQPWATLIALGEKKFETRSWATKHRGELAIHASKKIDRAACKTEPITEILNKHGIVMLNDLPTGVILATSTLVECFQVRKDYGGYAQLNNRQHIPLYEYQLGDYSVDRCAWELSTVKLLDKPIPAKGQLGLWNFQTLDFEVVYEVPPMRGLYRTVVNAISSRAAEEKIRTDPETMNYRIKEINEIK